MQFHTYIIRNAKAQGYVKTILGRKRFLPDINSTHPEKRAYAERQAVNSIIQGTASEVIKVAMLEVEHQLSISSDQYTATTTTTIDGTTVQSDRVDSSRDKRISTGLVMQVHDELIYEVASHASIDSFVNLLKKSMIDVVSKRLSLGVPLSINIQVRKLSFLKKKEKKKRIICIRCYIICTRSYNMYNNI